MPASPRRERAIARTREEILLAAADAFARAGYRAATVREIATAAGYTPAALYTYFKGKQELCEALIGLVTTEFLRTFAEPLPAGIPFRQKVEVVLRRHLELLDRRRGVMSALFDLPAGTLCKGALSPLTGFELRVGHFADWMRANATAADLGGHAPEHAARFLMGIGMAFFKGWLSAPERTPLVERVPLILDLFFHGIGRGKHDRGARR